MKGCNITIGTYGANDVVRLDGKYIKYYEILYKTISQIGQTRETLILGDLNIRITNRYFEYKEIHWLSISEI